MRTRIAVCLVSVLLILVAGCNPARVEQSSIMGTNAEVGEVLLRSVHVEGPPRYRYLPGQDAPVWLTLINSAMDPDALVEVTSPVAAEVEIRWDRDCDGRFETVPELPLPPVGPGVADPTAAAPPFDAYHLRLVDFTEPVLAGTTVPLALRFRHAGEVSLEVAVQPSTPRAEPTLRCVP